jgi:hypothetical protein
MNADDIGQLLQEIPVHPSQPAVVPIRTVQETAAAGDLPSLDVDAANVFSWSEHILQDHVRKHDVNATELRDLTQMVLEVAAELNKVLVMISYLISYEISYHMYI